MLLILQHENHILIEYQTSNYRCGRRHAALDASYPERVRTLARRGAGPAYVRRLLDELSPWHCHNGWHRCQGALQGFLHAVEDGLDPQVAAHAARAKFDALDKADA